MPLESFFEWAGRLALLGWLPMLLAPITWAWPRRLAIGVALLLALGYAALIGAFIAQGKGGFDSLANVRRLFDDDGLLLAGWVHYLAFDLAVGAWQRGEAARIGLKRRVLAPLLVLTFLFGPIGWLGFMAVRWWRGQGELPRWLKPWLELDRRQPQLARLALLMLIGIVPCLIAMQVDARTINGISVWIKPAKFFFSIAVYLATLAWFFGCLSPAARHGRGAHVVVVAASTASLLEMAWLLAAAVAGVPAHYNRQSMVWMILYPLAGVGATVMLAAIVVQARLIAKDAAGPGHPVYRRAVVWSSWLAAGLTLVTAQVLAAGSGHWVGGTPSDAGGLPLFGWSRDGGDLRVAHFFALHLHQAVPFLAWAALRWRPMLARPLVGLSLGLGAVVVGAVFVQALLGRPLIS
jgi:hypothetical protein